MAKSKRGKKTRASARGPKAVPVQPTIRQNQPPGPDVEVGGNRSRAIPAQLNVQQSQPSVPDGFDPFPSKSPTRRNKYGITRKEVLDRIFQYTSEYEYCTPKKSAFISAIRKEAGDLDGTRAITAGGRTHVIAVFEKSNADAAEYAWALAASFPWVSHSREMEEALLDAILEEATGSRMLEHESRAWALYFNTKAQQMVTIPNVIWDTLDPLVDERWQREAAKIGPKYLEAAQEHAKDHKVCKGWTDLEMEGQIFMNWARVFLRHLKAKDLVFYSEVTEALKAAYLDVRKDYLFENEANDDVEELATRAVVHASTENQRVLEKHPTKDNGEPFGDPHVPGYKSPRLRECGSIPSESITCGPLTYQVIARPNSTWDRAAKHLRSRWEREEREHHPKMPEKMQSCANALLAEGCTIDEMIHRVNTGWAEDILGTLSFKDPSFHAEIITALKTAHLDSRKDVIQEDEADKVAETLAVSAIVSAALENQKRVAEQKRRIEEEMQDGEVRRNLAIVDDVVREAIPTQVLQQIIATSESLGERLTAYTPSSSRTSLDETGATNHEAQRRESNSITTSIAPTAQRQPPSEASHETYTRPSLLTMPHKPNHIWDRIPAGLKRRWVVAEKTFLLEYQDRLIEHINDFGMKKVFSISEDPEEAKVLCYVVHFLEFLRRKDSQFVYRIADFLADANGQAMKLKARGWDEQLPDRDGRVRVYNIVAWARTLFLTGNGEGQETDGEASSAKAYIPYVAASVSETAIRNLLNRYGKAVNIEINREKKIAFAEFDTLAAFEAAAAANPHKIGNAYIRIQSCRRLKPGSPANEPGSRAVIEEAAEQEPPSTDQSPQLVSKPLEQLTPAEHHPSEQTPEDSVSSVAHNITSALQASRVVARNSEDDNDSSLFEDSGNALALEHSHHGVETADDSASSVASSIDSASRAARVAASTSEDGTAPSLSIAKSVALASHYPPQQATMPGPPGPPSGTIVPDTTKYIGHNYIWDNVSDELRRRYVFEESVYMPKYEESMRIQRKTISESATQSEGRMFLHLISSFLYWLQVEEPYFYTELVAALRVAYLKATNEDDGDEDMDEATGVARLALLFASSRSKRGDRCPYLEAEAKAYEERAKSKESCAPSPFNPVSVAASAIEEMFTEIKMIQRKIQIKLDRQSESEHSEGV